MIPTLRQRVLLAVAPLLLLLAALGGSGALLLVRLGDRADAILRENYDSVRAMDRLTAAVARADRALLADDRREFDAGWAEIDRQLDVERANVTIFPDEPQRVAELEAALRLYRSAGELIFALPPGAAARAKARAGPAADARRAVVVRAEAVRDLNEAHMQAASRDARDTARTSAWAFAAGVAASLLLAAAAVWWLQRTILGPIRAVTEAAEAVGGGQLHLLVPVAGPRELGRLAEAFNGMAGKLRAYRQTDLERLRRARQAAQATIDSFPDPVIVLDTLGRVESANPAAARLLGVRGPGEGEPALEWHPPAALADPVRDALRDQRATTAETFDRAATFRLDGEERAYLPQVRPIRSPGGDPLGAAVVLADVTRFRLLDRLKSDWVATVSHELKTPLTGVRLAVHVLLEEVVGPLEPKQVELLIEARENTERLLKLIEHLLALARLEDGREPLALRPCAPADLLRAAAADARARAEDRRVEVVVEAADGLPPVAADADRFGRALGNLIDNALVHTGPGGRVTLAAAPTADGRVRLSVADTGVGIPAEHLPHVFERFFRVPGRERTPGTGLGLAIVREVAAAHGGEVACESEPGRGTTFHITLPAREATL
jgi:PAS domain S-box-containing protein